VSWWVVPAEVIQIRGGQAQRYWWEADAKPVGAAGGQQGCGDRTDPALLREVVRRHARSGGAEDLGEHPNKKSYQRHGRRRRPFAHPSRKVIPAQLSTFSSAGGGRSCSPQCSWQMIPLTWVGHWLHR
jgi:hypothetical protein